MRSNEAKINCTLISNPLATVNWMFLPREASSQSATTTAASPASAQNTSEQHNDWISINHLATYSLKYNSNENTQLEEEHAPAKSNSSSLIRIPLSKYQIYQHHINHNTLSSILVIKQITEKDAGVYKCFASNDAGNKSVEFRLQVLDSETESSERQRTLMKNKKNPYSVEKPKNYKSKFTKSKTNTGAEVTESGESSKAHEFRDEDYTISSGSASRLRMTLLLALNLVVVSYCFN
jgi:hypothetical protein